MEEQAVKATESATQATETAPKGDFDWMNYKVPAAIRERGADHRKSMHLQEIKDRARMMRRFGHPQSFAVHRSLCNLYWGFELHGEPALTADEVRKIVSDVYGRPGAD